MPDVEFRPLRPGDADELNTAQRIMALDHYSFAFDYQPGQDFEAYLTLLNERKCGRNLKPGTVASSFEVGLFANHIVARLSVRHALNDFLLEQGGHLGYAVLPEFRGRGLGAACLRRGLELTSALEIEQTLVTCDEDNAVSRHIIERAGGRYESSYFDSVVCIPVRRYWFDTSLRRTP